MRIKAAEVLERRQNTKDDGDRDAAEIWGLKRPKGTHDGPCLLNPGYGTRVKVGGSEVKYLYPA